MSSQYTNLHNRKPAADGPIFAVVFAIAVIYQNGLAAQWCGLGERIGWAVFQILRLVLLTPFFAKATSHVSEASRLLHVLLQVGPWFCCLLHFVAGRA